MNFNQNIIYLQATSAEGGRDPAPGPLLQPALILRARTPPHWRPALDIEVSEECAQCAPQNHDRNEGEGRHPHVISLSY